MKEGKNNLAEIRREYVHESLRKKDLNENPFEQFQTWFDDAVKFGITDPTAMILATVGSDGRPCTRTVLLKGVEDGGFVFFTNYDSRKAQELEGNPQASLLFLWMDMFRQVRIQGKAERISEEKSTEYFQSRPRGSQISAMASNQSSVIENKDVLENRVAELEHQYANIDAIPKPENWGGYTLIPDEIEIWIGRPSRLHDRFQYSLKDGKWSIERLSP